MDAYFGEIRLLPYVFTNPLSWLPCDGRAVLIQQYPPLYAVIGRSFTLAATPSTQFNLPNLQAMTVAGSGQGAGLTNRAFAKTFGEETVLVNALPGHTHGVHAKEPTAITDLVNTPDPTCYLARTKGQNDFAPYSSSAAVNMGSAIGTSGQMPIPHNNMQPYLTMRYFICTDGIFPMRS